MENPAAEIIEILCSRGLTLGTVESATGGLMAHLLTNVPGSSAALLGSVVSYSNGIKINVVGVQPATLQRYGAVSPQVARQMASGGRRVLGVDICVADTGIAGPGGGKPGKPVGLFYIGLSHAGGTYSRKHLFHGNREENKLAAALAALGWVREWLGKDVISVDKC
ncbi:MAG: CinA family protein [Dehalococcoidia bacterium]|nr:CinA family protein [Dehalococcoidia bacterium]